MRRVLWSSLIVLAALLGVGERAEAQTRADSAAVLLNAADALRLRGETGAARAVLDLIARQYGGTPAAAEVDAMRALLRRTPDAERSGRTELLVFGTTFGAGLGISLPVMFESDEPAAYGVGLLLGAPAGFLAARRYADAKLPSDGQARAITFGATWGIYQAIAWTEVLDIGKETFRDCPPPEFPGDCYEYESDTDGTTIVTAGTLGGLAGIGAGAWLARKPISAGTAAAVTLSGMWSTWFGWGLTYLTNERDSETLLTAALLAGNAGLVGSALAAPSWQMSESRARLISLGGIIGGLAGAGTLLIIQPDDERTAVAVPLLGSAIGLAAGAYRTRTLDARDSDGGDNRGALLNVSNGKWALDTPLPQLRMQRTDAGLRTGAYVPLLRASF